MKLKKVAIMAATSVTVLSTTLTPVMTSFAQNKASENKVVETKTPEAVLKEARENYEKIEKESKNLGSVLGSSLESVDSQMGGL